MAGTSACAAVLVPLECIVGFRGRPYRPCRRRNSGSCEWVCHTHVHHGRTAGQEREQVTPLCVALAAWWELRGWWMRLLSLLLRRLLLRR